MAELFADDDLSRTVNELGIPGYRSNGELMKFEPNPDNPKDDSHRWYGAHGLNNHCPEMYEASIY